jgi:hypothetical protein
MNDIRNVKFFIFCIILFLFPSLHTNAQGSIYPKGSTLWLVDMFFNQPYFPEKEKYYSGEMLQDVNYPTIGEEDFQSDSISYRKIAANNQAEVYSITITKYYDSRYFYCYLFNDAGTWKIDAIRKFQLPAFIHEVADSLTRTEQAPDTTLNLQRMLELMTSSDEELKTYLSDNVNSFYTIINDFENNRPIKLKTLMNQFGLESIYYDDLYQGCIFIMIGKIDRFEIGYIFSPNKSALPGITPQRFIYIEEILPKWFVYRVM